MLIVFDIFNAEGEAAYIEFGVWPLASVSLLSDIAIWEGLIVIAFWSISVL